MQYDRVASARPQLIVETGNNLGRPRAHRFVTWREQAKAARVSLPTREIENDQVEARFSSILCLAKALGAEPEES
ncbi:MAG: hypothetical protein M3M97_04830 [Actinomycetota bacterium]|nr:hypothetical protein [Actinomycetota bacterium]